MSTAGHTSVIRGPGTSTAFTLEPTLLVTANTRYQVLADLRRLLDPSVAPVVEVDADGTGAGGYVVAAANTYTVNYMFGIITFIADQGALAVVRVSGSYLPAIDLVGVTDWSYSASREVLDTTTVNTTAGSVRTKSLGLADVSGSVTLNELLSYDHDPGAGVLVLETYLDNATPLLFESSAGGKRFRAWVLLESADRAAGGVADLVNSTVNFTGAARVAGAGYGWEA